MVFSCFSDVGHKKKNRNKNHQDKLFRVVKSIGRCVMDVLMREKNNKAFLCSSRAQIKIKICAISRRRFLYIKKSHTPVLNRRKKSGYLDIVVQRSLSRLFWVFFRRPSPELSTLDQPRPQIDVEIRCNIDRMQAITGVSSYK